MIQPLYIIHEDIVAGRLVPVLSDWKLPLLTINLAYQSRRHQPAKIRVFNPTPSEHGWRSTHTVVEIANDDMPFLVDSVTAELNRQELTVHLVIHPVLQLRRDAAG